MNNLKWLQVQEFLQPTRNPVNRADLSVHKPFKFTVALNKAVPLMHNSLASCEMLPKVTLKWFRTSVEGKQEHTSSALC
ncbi:type VI secretion system tube protein Hcp [Aeromonas dhakensis]|uniref:type VI secretion system tube protein Hcp n=1 Tax=Aeromonas dhakensis TaxID=196024 RepID=UPI003BF96A4E